LEGDAGVYAELCQLIPDDAETKSHFMEMEPTAREARYLLRRIEEAKRSLLGQDELRPDRSLTLEHVLPQDPSSWNDQPGWERISEREHARLVGLPGNLTLLTGRRNKQLQNSPFRRKRSMYEKSELQITKDIASHDVWTESQIRSRTKDLLTLALKVWRKG